MVYSKLFWSRISCCNEQSSLLTWKEWIKWLVFLQVSLNVLTWNKRQFWKLKANWQLFKGSAASPFCQNRTLFPILNIIYLFFIYLFIHSFIHSFWDSVALIFKSWSFFLSFPSAQITGKCYFIKIGTCT
jgi:hypothetical protein